MQSSRQRLTRRIKMKTLSAEEQEQMPGSDLLYEVISERGGASMVLREEVIRIWRRSGKLEDGKAMQRRTLVDLVIRKSRPKEGGNGMVHLDLE